MIKYYKGLGTSSTEDAKKYFANLNFHVKEFKPCNQGERELVDIALVHVVTTRLRPRRSKGVQISSLLSDWLLLCLSL